MPGAVAGTRATSTSALASVSFLLLGLLAAIVYLSTDSMIVSGLAIASVATASAAALLIAPKWYGVERRWPWTLLAAACLAFLVGALFRPWTSVQHGALAFIADAFTIPGYGLMFAGLAGFLRTRRGEKRHALIDGLIVGVGAGLAAALLFSVPAAGVEDRSAAISGLAFVYPLFDVVLVLLVINLAFTTVVRGPSYQLLIASMVMLLAGDTAYAIIGRTGELTGSRLLDLPFIFGFALIGASAAHRTLRDIGQVARLPVQGWSVHRLLLLGPALAVPFVLTVLIAHNNLLDRVVLAVGGATMVTLLLVRAVSAVQGFAAAQRRYEHQATHDHLTGLPNRALLVAEVGHLLHRPGEPLWLYFLDLDGFKLVNDSWGHDAGDRVIVEVAQRLRATVPEGATLARVGGDEFVIAHPGTQAEAGALADAILSCVLAPLPAPAGGVVVAGSVGIAKAVEGSGRNTAESLLRDADTAMYQAKAEGRGRWVMFDPSMHDRVRERIDTELALRQALAGDQFRLAYQPIVALASGELVGAEALIRWDHPQRGAIPPAAFIPVAEDSGLIADVGRWVLHAALRQLAEWRHAGVVPDDFWISINVSPRQLRDLRLPGEVADALIRYAVPGVAVTLEITESVMIDGSDVTDQVLARLRSLGVRVVVDDFGTGFSALGYLRKHPVTGVKIDRSFVGGLGVNPEDEEIVRAVVAMSGALGLSMVAEGVQTPAQRDVLRTLGVVHGQGWLWGRPVAPEPFAEIWGASSTRQLERPVGLLVEGGGDDVRGERSQGPRDGVGQTDGLVAATHVERRNAAVGTHRAPELFDH
jgi:diguanylate cyclase (GGDEF)-like protein